jgi:Cys-rich repeat protein
VPPKGTACCRGYLATCATDSQCCTGTCVNGFEKGPVCGCISDADCPSGERCISGLGLCFTPS